jgi:hypothetical protein
MSRDMLGAKHWIRRLNLYRVWPEKNHDDWWLLMDESEQSAIEWIAEMYGVSTEELRASRDSGAEHTVPVGVVLRANGETKTKGEK